MGESGTADDVDTSKLSIAGKGGNDTAISLTVTPAIAKVDTDEFSLTVDTADRKSMLDILDIGGYSASDRSLYSIVLEQNWNGLSSPALSVPVRNTNIPPGYCGTLPSDPAKRPTIFFVSDSLGVVASNPRTAILADEGTVRTLSDMSAALTSTSVVEIYQYHATGTTFGGAQGFRFCRVDLLSCD